MTPRRIQRKRTKGWRMPEGAVYVGRPSLFGNGWEMNDAVEYRVPVAERRAWVVRRYRTDLEHFGMLSDYSYVVSDAKWQAVYDDIERLGAKSMAEYVPFVLRGHDLVCWCPEACGEDVDLGWNEYGGPWDPCALPRGHAGHHDPSAGPYCHADVLLELANA